MSASMPMRMVPPRTSPVAVGAGPDTKTRAASTPSITGVLIASSSGSPAGDRSRAQVVTWEPVSASDYPEIRAELRERIQQDPWAAALGIQYLDLRRGYCRVRLRFQPHMVNFQRSEEHTSELQSLAYLVCRLLLEKK